ncbi:MAG: translation initiation factor IF-1 [Solitalea-like symbiont of Acarus siro]
MAKDKQEYFEQDAEVVRNHGKGNFEVQLKNGVKINAVLSGKVRSNYIKVIPGDKVKLEISAYNPELARIVYRY